MFCFKYRNPLISVLGEGQECSLVDDNGDGEMYGAYVEEEENKHDGWIACKQKASFMHIFCSLNVFHQIKISR